MPTPSKKPFKHQVVSLKHADTTPVVFDCSDPGTGKTAVATWFMAKRKKRKGKAAVVLAPKSLLRTVWYNEIRSLAPELKVVIATATDRGEMFNQVADVYITNLDAAKWLGKQRKGFFDRFEMLVMDESSAFKHHTSQRSRAMAKIAKYFKYRRAMTGTPNGRSITDVWHQVYLLDDGKRLGSSFYAFRNTVCAPRQVGRNANAIEWSDKDGAEEAVFGLLQDIVIRHKFEDCVDIPPCHHYTMEYQLPPKHMKIYEEFARKQVMEFQKKSFANASAKLLGEKAQDVTTVAAVHAASLMQKLLQIASGSVYGIGGEPVLVDEGRYNLVLDLVEQRKNVLVFFFWTHQRDALVAEATKRGLNFCVMDGGTSDIDRVKHEAAFQRGEYDAMFAHPRTVAHGYTLTRGTTTIWTGPTPDLELFVQGSKRQHRIGQKEKTEVITIIAPYTYDVRVYHEILMPKSKRMTTLLDLFAS
jgi:SNF2 family DNA or RNA helicase